MMDVVGTRPPTANCLLCPAAGCSSTCPACVRFSCGRMTRAFATVSRMFSKWRNCVDFVIARTRPSQDVPYKLSWMRNGYPTTTSSNENSPIWIENRTVDWHGKNGNVGNPLKSHCAAIQNRAELFELKA